MSRFKDILKGGDLRSIGKANFVAAQVNNQQAFDELFSELYNTDRKIVMRAADAIEKITASNSKYLQHHKGNILSLFKKANDIELKWHLALLVSRLNLTKKEVSNVWNILTTWATDKEESKIVRVNSLQGLFNILQNNEELTNGELIKDFNRTLKEVQRENIPSINARIRRLKNGIC